MSFIVFKPAKLFFLAWILWSINAVNAISFEHKMLEPEFFWRMSQDFAKLKQRPAVYQNFLKLLLATFNKNVAIDLKIEVEKSALNFLQNSWLLPQDKNYRDVLKQFCQLLCCLHTEDCGQQVCGRCRNNIAFLLDNRLAIKNLLYATVAKNSQRQGWRKRTFFLAFFTATTLPCGLLALAMLLMLREPQKYAFSRRWFGQTVPLCQFIHQADLLKAQIQNLELQIQQTKTEKHGLCEHVTTLQQQQAALKQNVSSSAKALQQLLQQLCVGAQGLTPQLELSQNQIYALRQQLATLNAKLLSLEHPVS